MEVCKEIDERHDNNLAVLYDGGCGEVPTYRVHRDVDIRNSENSASCDE